MNDTSEDDKRIHEALMTCCDAMACGGKLRIERELGNWWATVRIQPRDQWNVEGWRSWQVSAASPEGALIALAKELKNEA